jgi:hypothetical protein
MLLPYTQPGRQPAGPRARLPDRFSRRLFDRLPQRLSGELCHLHLRPLLVPIMGEHIERLSRSSVKGVLERHRGAYPEQPRVYPGYTPCLPSKPARARAERHTK